MSERNKRALFRRSALVSVGLAAAALLAACSSSGGSSGSSSGGSAPAGGGTTAAAAAGLMNKGTLTVGMNLQFKPEMYLDPRATTSTCSRSSPTSSA
jgi:ABC-type amino acid transport substrate-binding protein